jgi:cysteine-rich repeat protein
MRIEIGETCDDGNRVGGDGCSETCIAEPQELLDTGAETIRFELPKPKIEPIFLPQQNIFLPAKLPDT